MEYNSEFSDLDGMYKKELTENGYELYDDKDRCVYKKEYDYGIWFKYDDVNRIITSMDTDKTKRIWKYNKYGAITYFEDSLLRYKISFKYNMNKKIKRYTEIVDGRKTDVYISYKHGKINYIRSVDAENEHLWIYDKNEKPIYHKVNDFLETWKYNSFNRVSAYENNKGLHLTADYSESGKFSGLNIVRRENNK